MPTIRIPTPLRTFAGGHAKVTVEGNTVGEALNALVTHHPELRQHLYEGETLRNFVNVFIGEEDVRFMNGAETEIDPNAELRIIPSIAGGMR